MMLHALAANVLALWEQEVRPFAPDEHLRWQQLLAQLPDTLPAATLRRSLSPIVAKNDKEQALFEEIFQRALADYTRWNATLQLPEPSALSAAPDTPVPPPVKKPSRRRRDILLTLTGLIALLAMAWLLYRLNNSKPERETLNFTLQTGQNDSIRLPSKGLMNTFTNAFFGNETNPATFSDTLITPLARYTFYRDTILSIQAGTVAGTDTLYFTLLDKGTFRFYEALVQISPSLSECINRDSLPSATDPATWAFRHEMPYPAHDSLFTTLRAPTPDPVGAALHRWAGAIKALAALLLALLLAAWVYRRARRRQKLVVRRERSQKPPYIWNIRISELPPPESSEALGPALNALRRRTADEQSVLDLPATVRATIQRGGMADFRFRSLSRPPEYLMLIEQHNALDHRARLHDDLYRLLRQQEVLVERFFYDGDLRLCSNEQFPEGQSLDELLFRYPLHRLLIVGSGRQLFNATGRLARWTDSLLRWRHRALLSPLPAAQWGRREQTLAQHFRLAPVSPEGLRRVAEGFEADRDLQAPAPEILSAAAALEPIALEAGDLLYTLHLHFPDPDTRLWLSACCIWPELHYDLTLWIGYWLAQESGRPMVQMQRLSDMLRLPWFAEGHIPDEARAELLQWLRSTQPELETSLRMALHALLEKNAPPEDSAAWEDFEMRVAFNEWMFAKDPKRRSELEAKIAEWMQRNGNPDLLVVQALQGKPGPMDNLLPERWKKILFKNRLPVLGLQDWLRDTLRYAAPLWAAACAALLWGWNPAAPKGCNGEIKNWTDPKSGQNLELCIDSPEKQALYYEMSTLAYIESEVVPPPPAPPEVYSQLSDSTLRRECEANLANALFNHVITPFNTLDSLKQRYGLTNPNYQQKKDIVCAWFEAAWQRDSSLPWVAAARNWCSDNPLPLSQPEYACYEVTDAAAETGFRNRILSLAELRSIANRPNSALARQTLIRALKPGQKVVLTDSSDANFYRVLLNNTPGFIAKSVAGKPTLRPCGSAQAPSIEIPRMVSVPGGSFTMGCTEGQGNYCQEDEKPPHLVQLSSYAIGMTEVTNAQYVQFLNEKGNQSEGGVEWINVKGDDGEEKCRISLKNNNTFVVEAGYENHPVIYVSWYGAKAYCAWLTAKTGRVFRLPTEAEWEYAARGGQAGAKDGFKYAGSNDIEAVAWYTKNTNDTGTRPVAGKKPNQLGLYDMSGNVYEWCSDWWGDYEASDKAQNNPTGAKEGSYRVLRGGSWDYGAGGCRVSLRYGRYPDDSRNFIGFRVVSPR